MSKKRYPVNWHIPKHQIVTFSPRRNKYCVCVPVINEGERLKAELRQLAKLYKSIDIIIADGGSSDGSTNEKFLQSQHVRTLLTKMGRGRLSAQLRMAYAYALSEGYEGIITIDGNGKDDVNDIVNFIQALDQGYDLVQGSRFIKGGKAINTPLSRLVAIKLIHAPLTSLAARRIYTDTTNGFRGYSRQLLLDPDLAIFRDIFSEYELLFYLSIRSSLLKYKIIEVPVTRQYPKGKIPTKINFFGNFKILYTLIRVMLGYYD